MGGYSQIEGRALTAKAPNDALHIAVSAMHGIDYLLWIVLAAFRVLVYDRCMSRTNVNIDDQACAEVMRRYQLETKREAINFALRMLAAEPVSVNEARALRGIGWVGDLDAMRSSRLL